jgi:hypothetical protein
VILTLPRPQPRRRAWSCPGLAQQQLRLVFLAIFLASVSLFAALVHIAPMAQGLDIDVVSSQWLIALIGAGNVLGRPLLGGLGDRLGALRLLMGLSLFLALLHLLWWQAHGWAALAVFPCCSARRTAAASPCFPSWPPSGSAPCGWGPFWAFSTSAWGWRQSPVPARPAGCSTRLAATPWPSRSAPLALLAVAALALAARGQRLASISFRQFEMIMHSSSSSGTLFAEDACPGWARNVLLSWDESGRLAEVLTDVDPQSGEAGEVDTAIRAAGPVIPGMPNLHSHAFQRAFGGLTEFRGQAQDSFWSWRKLMYGFANRMTPEALEAIAPGCTWRCWRPATPRCASSTMCTMMWAASPMPTMPACPWRCCVRRRRRASA